MADIVEVDVVIGGGGVAGTAAAVALQQLGYRIVLIEPGQNDHRRLAGEVFHPPGVAGLAELGLLRALTGGSIATINGFCVFSDGDCIRLPYDAVPAHSQAGICLEHGQIRERMMDAARALPNVVVKQGARVVGVDQSEASRVLVDVANGTANSRYRCRMLIAADGAPSRLARLAGIAVRDRRISTVIGYRIGLQNLPQSDFGYVYLGAATPILVYPIGHGQARVLFDIPYQPGRPASAADCLVLSAAMPAALRDEVAQAIANQPRVSVSTKAITPETSVQGRVVLVGDAGGCCHPLTATGMTMCVSDALLLRQALIARPNDIAAALRLYEQRRCWPQATRLLLADALRDAFIGASPEMRVVRYGVLSHWRRSATGRIATLALLSTADGRLLSLLRQIVTVMVCGLIAHRRSPLSDQHGMTTLTLARALAGSLYRNVCQVWQGVRISARRNERIRERGRLSVSDERTIGVPPHPAIAGKPGQVD